MQKWNKERRNTLFQCKETSETYETDKGSWVYFSIYNSQGFARSVSLPVMRSSAQSLSEFSVRPESFFYRTKLLRPLGTGGFSQVFLGKDLKTEGRVTVKITSTISEERKKAAKNEASILKALQRHPNIVQYYGHKVFEHASLLYMEYFQSTDLFYLLTKCSTLSVCVLEKIFTQLVSGVSFLHRSRICHLDIKPENILINKKCQLKLIDFGMAQVSLKNGQVEAYGGSVKYASPEAMLGGIYNGFLADSWSCGVVLFIIMHGRFPDPASLTFPSFPPAPHISGMVERLLKIDPEKRAPITLFEDIDLRSNTQEKYGRPK
ncbi:BR serine/threonine kinase [Nematocida sp. AWRm77]|nr:BR serine/threonine kinase [Nematocida sp. AWRm77]